MSVPPCRVIPRTGWTDADYGGALRGLVMWSGGSAVCGLPVVRGPGRNACSHRILGKEKGAKSADGSGRNYGISPERWPILRVGCCRPVQRLDQPAQVGRPRGLWSGTGQR